MNKEYEDSNLRKNILADSLTYLDPEWIRDSNLARGVFTGLVSGIMSQGHSFSSVIRTLKLVAVEKKIKVDINRIPEAWREEWNKSDHPDNKV